MKKLIVSILFVSFNASAESVSIQKLLAEGVKSFVQRITKSEVHQPDQFAETSVLATGKNTIVAFTERKGQDGSGYDLDLNVLRPLVGDSYAWTKIDACFNEGGGPTLRSFFYVNADKLDDKEIGIICGWDASHRSHNFEGFCSLNDEVKFFKVSSNGDLSQLEDPAFKDLFYEKKEMVGKKEKWSCTFSKFKNADDVKKILKR